MLIVLVRGDDGRWVQFDEPTNSIEKAIALTRETSLPWLIMVEVARERGVHI